MNTGRAVLALDEILRRITPEQAAALRAMAPTWFADQADASITEIRTNLQIATDIGLAECVDDISNDEHPGWVRLGMLDALVTWWCGKHSSCIHDPHPLRPQPVVAAAWKPGRIVCKQCTHLLDLPKNSTADRTCDGCGRVVSGEDDDLMCPFVVTAGVLTYTVGACRDCCYWEDA